MKRALVLALVLALLVAACATPPPPEEIEAANVREIDRFTSTAAAGAVGTYEGSNGARLAYVGYPETTARGRCAVVFLHGLYDHAEWLDLAARALRAKRCAVFGLDRRGSGRSRKSAGFPPEEGGPAATLIADVRRFVLALRERYRHVYLAGFSWGGRLALAYAVQHPSELDGVILVAPDLVGEPSVGPTVAWKLVSDPGVRARLTGDPMRLASVTPETAEASRGLAERIRKGIGGIDLPVLLLLAEADEVVDNDATTRLLDESPITLSKFQYEGVRHAIALEAPDRLASDAKRWIRSQRRR